MLTAVIVTGVACHCLSSPVIAQPGNHFVSQCRLLRLQTLCRKATRAIQLAALLSPEERSKQSRGPNDNLHRCSGYTILPRPLPIEFFMTVASPSAEQLPRIGPRPGRETPPRRVQCACVCVHQMGPQQILSEDLIRGICTPRLSWFVTGAA